GRRAAGSGRPGPAAWFTPTADRPAGLQARGGLGIRTYLGGSLARTFSYDDLWAGPIGAEPVEPGGPGDEPGDPGDEPGDPGDEPGDPGDEPGDPGDEPGDPGDEPGDAEAFAADEFERAVTGGWGTADVGGAWSIEGRADQFAVTGGAGRHVLSGGATASSYLTEVSETDTDL